MVPVLPKPAFQAKAASALTPSPRLGPFLLSARKFRAGYWNDSRSEIFVGGAATTTAPIQHNWPRGFRLGAFSFEGRFYRAGHQPKTPMRENDKEAAN